MLKWHTWLFKAGEEYELPRGCDGVRRRVEAEPGVWEYVAVCPQVISLRQAVFLFYGVRELRHCSGRVVTWDIGKRRLLEFDFEECERTPGVFYPPVIPTGRPKAHPIILPPSY